ncbi:MAG: SH3 domain-containing protein, partial [Armatimonadetes bacterium]|nr:SH3 domain-containing protein [Anaerolineae bacterium]
ELVAKDTPTGLTGLPGNAQPEAVDFDMFAALEVESSVTNTPAANTNVDDLFAGLFDDAAPAGALAGEGDIEDVDAFLASLQSSDVVLDDAGDDDSEIDFDALFDERGLSKFDAAQAPQARQPDSPDFLSNVAVSTSSASALMRQQQDRPLEDLSDRLMALREDGLNLPAVTTNPVSGTLAQLFPGSKDGLPAASVQVSKSSLTDALRLTPEQARNVALLTSLTGASAAAAGDMAAVPVAQPRFRLALKLDRLLLTAVVVIAMLLPFFGILRLGELPPTQFTVGSTAQTAFDQVDALRPTQLVLVAAEYGATAAGELDDLTDAVLRHVVLRGARPVIVSSNPTGLLRTELRMTGLAGDALLRNRDYFIGRYIAGEAVGLRAFSQDINALTRLDAQGQLTGLDVQSLDDFALIVIITDRVDGVRSWSEQIMPLTRTPLLFAASASAAPLAAPYAQASGLLIGYRDAYTYARLLEAGLAAPLPLLATDTPTETPLPTERPTQRATSQPTVIPPTSATLGTTQAPTDVLPTNTRDAAQTVTSTPTPSPTDTPAAATTAAPVTATPQPSATVQPTATAGSGRVARVIAAQAVNVRAGPGSDFAVIASLQPGATVPVLGENAAGDWIQVRLDDGREGWVSAPLLSIETALSASGRTVFGFGIGWSYMRPVAQRQTPSVTATVTATPTSTATAMSSAAVRAPYADERWYSMTAGILAIIAVIIVGNVISLFRRAMRSQRKS